MKVFALVVLALGCTDSKRLVITSMPIAETGRVVATPYRAKVLLGGYCPHEVLVAWSADAGHVTGGSLRLERRQADANVTGSARLERFSPDMTYGDLSTDCVGESEWASRSIRVFADGTIKLDMMGVDVCSGREGTRQMGYRLQLDCLDDEVAFLPP